MKRPVHWCILFVCLFGGRVSNGQRLTVSVDGYQRWEIIQSQVDVPGPLKIDPNNLRFTYGLSVSYESGRNGVEAGVMAYPYRIDLRFKNFFSGQSGPSNIALFTLLYRRRLLVTKKHKLALYALAGVGVGHYRNNRIQYGTGTVSVNGTVVYSDHFDGYSTYDRSVVLLPVTQLELEKSLSPRLFIRARATYVFPNFAGFARPLEQATYSYTYQQQNGRGTLTDYGNGSMVGLSLGYQITL